jgi:hypothetical protein
MSEQPKRIQRKRTKGWRMPEGAVYVGRPTKWGNRYAIGAWVRLSAERLPFRVADARHALALFTVDALASDVFQSHVRRELRGKDLACWCQPSEPCHADVLLEIANEADRKATDV